MSISSISLARRISRRARRALLARGASLIVVTRGTNGALGLAPDGGGGRSRRAHGRRGRYDRRRGQLSGRAAVRAPPSWADRAANLQNIGAADLRRALSFACKCAALTCTRAGADPPRRNEMSGFW